MAASIDNGSRRIFRPALAQTMATALLLPALIALGVWQLHRADEKSALLAARSSAQRAAPQPVEKLAASSLPRHAQASGYYDDHLFLLDNRVSEGVAGYELLAPLHLADGRAVLVDLGWLEQGVSRVQLPVVTVPGGEQMVTGLALAPAPPAFTLSQRETVAPGWPKVVQTALPQRLAATVDFPLLPLVIYPDGSAVAAHQLEMMQTFGPPRHRAYALQWFSMAALLLMFYVRHGLRRGSAT